MTNRAFECEFDRILHEYVFGHSEKESKPETNEEKIQEPVSTCIEYGFTFTQVLQYLENEYVKTKSLDEDDEAEADYYLMAKHPLLEGVYITLIEDCTENGYKTTIYPYIAAVDKDENELEDFQFPKEAWFDGNWSIHKIYLN